MNKQITSSNDTVLTCVGRGDAQREGGAARLVRPVAGQRRRRCGHTHYATTLLRCYATTLLRRYAATALASSSTLAASSRQLTCDPHKYQRALILIRVGIDTFHSFIYTGNGDAWLARSDVYE